LNKFLYRLFIGFVLLLCLCLLDKYEKLDFNSIQNDMSKSIRILNVITRINGNLNIIDLGTGSEIAVSKDYVDYDISETKTKIKTDNYTGVKNYNAGVVTKIIKYNIKDNNTNSNDLDNNSDNKNLENINQEKYSVYIESIDGDIYEYSNLDSIDVHIYSYLKINDIIGLSSDYYELRKVSD